MLTNSERMFSISTIFSILGSFMVFSFPTDTTTTARTLGVKNHFIPIMKNNNFHIDHNNHYRKSLTYSMMGNTIDENEINNEIVFKAYKNLMDDLTSMKTARKSKFSSTINNNHGSFHNTRRASNYQKKQQLLHLLSQNQDLCNLYGEEGGNHYYFTNITNIVGPMHRNQVEMMIQKHPKLMTDILSHTINMYDDEDDRSKRNSRTNMRELRSVQDQIIFDLQLSQSEEQSFKLIIQKKASTFSKMNRNNVRSICQTFSKLGMQNELLCKVLSKSPELFLYSNINIQQSISFLHDGLDLTNEEICKMIAIRPTVLAHCNKEGKKMDKIVGFFRDDLSTDYKKIVIRYPQVFELKAHLLMEKVIHQNHITFSLSRDHSIEISTILKRIPMHTSFFSML